MVQLALALLLRMDIMLKERELLKPLKLALMVVSHALFPVPPSLAVRLRLVGQFLPLVFLPLVLLDREQQVLIITVILPVLPVTPLSSAKTVNKLPFVLPVCPDTQLIQPQVFATNSLALPMELVNQLKEPLLIVARNVIPLKIEVWKKIPPRIHSPLVDAYAMLPSVTSLD